MKIIALVPAAGSGDRMGGGTDDKPFFELGGKPVLAHVLERLDASADVDKIVLIVKDKYVERAKKAVSEYAIKKVTDVIAGGKTRTESVSRGIAASGARDGDLILIHDGARPFVTGAVISKAVEAAKSSGAAVAGIPCSATIKNVNGDRVIEGTPDRSGLWEAQTPQVFRADLIREAYNSGNKREATDDSSMVERLGHKVSMVEGSRYNIKITVLEDLELAETILGMGRERCA
jgi:2-C-methyl-D-erythritol 4-phosphate cytidylyltransferase